MNDNQFKFSVLVAVMVFIAVIFLISVIAVLVSKYLKTAELTDTICDLEALSGNMSRDVNVHKNYIYRLDQCIRILKTHLG